MGIEQFYTKEVADTELEYLPGSDRWWVKVRALDARERREREQIMVRENLKRPKNDRALKQVQESEYQETSLEYQVARIKEYEYDHALVDFVLPYVPKGKTSPVDFTKAGKTRDDVKEFLDKLPAPLEAFIEDQISKVNKEGKYAKEAEEVKNDSEPSSEKV